MTAPLLVRALEVASLEVGVREVGQNRGERVEEYGASVGLPVGLPYCAAFVYWCFEQGANGLQVPNPVPKVWAVNKLWRKAHLRYRTVDPAPGLVFVHFEHPGNPYSLGHTGIVEHIGDGYLVTVEANTNEYGSREGQGVYRMERPLPYVNVGYLDFSRDEEPVA